METKAKVFKRKSGKSKGKWVARVEYFDEQAGVARTMERLCDKKADAIDEKNRLVLELKKSDGQIRKGERMSFGELAEICAERLYKPAVLSNGRKIEGVRAHNTALNHLKVLTLFFGPRRLGQITTKSLSDYRAWRFKIGSRHPSVLKNGWKPVSIATINRELSAMRRIMRFALGEGWVTRDIFFKSEVINPSAEMERDRLLTHDEEKRLLEACRGSRETTYERTRFGKKETITATKGADNPHLRALILLALDSGMRRGEILNLRWEDIDFESNTIRVLGTHTKTERERTVPLTERVKAELRLVREFTPGDRPFPFADFKRSWTTAKRLAGIEDLHFHDLRRTAITRWIMQGNPIALAGKIAGHTQLQTTMKHYTSVDAEIVQKFTDSMNAAQGEIETSE